MRAFFILSAAAACRHFQLLSLHKKEFSDTFLSGRQSGVRYRTLWLFYTSQ
jgi:hypothetical protein